MKSRTIRFDRSHHPDLGQVQVGPREIRRALSAAVRDRTISERQCVSIFQTLGERQVLAPEAVFFLVARLALRRSPRRGLGPGRSAPDLVNRTAAEALSRLGEPLMADLYLHRREIFDEVFEAGRRSLKRTLK